MISLQTFKEKALMSLVGETSSFIKNRGNDFFEKYLLYTIRSKGLETVQWHRAKGHHSFIMSASPDIYVKHLSDYLNCDGYACSILDYSNDKFIGKFSGKDCIGVEKIERMQSIVQTLGINLGDSYAYSDNESDLPLLEWVGNPVVVNPTAVLQKIATGKDWKIEQW